VVDSQSIAIIGLICTLGGFIIAILTFNRGRDKDVRSDATKNAVIETKLDNISQSVNSIVVDIKKSELRWNSMDKEVARMDESLKSAHKRIDKLENQGEMRNE
jgi:peptidoglycan hydrolase CwlO-like protein